MTTTKGEHSTMLTVRLTADHLAHLRASGLSDETIIGSGVYSLRTPANAAEHATANNKDRAREPARDGDVRDA